MWSIWCIRFWGADFSSFNLVQFLLPSPFLGHPFNGVPPNRADQILVPCVVGREFCKPTKMATKEAEPVIPFTNWAGWFMVVSGRKLQNRKRLPFTATCWRIGRAVMHSVHSLSAFVSSKMWRQMWLFWCTFVCNLFGSCVFPAAYTVLRAARINSSIFCLSICTIPLTNGSRHLDAR